MAINLASSFGMNAALPLDDRTVVATTVARDAIVAGKRYEGMMVYVTATQVTYQLKGGILNANWAPIADLDTDGTLAANSDSRISSQKAVKTYADTKLPSTYLDTDGTLAANSDTKIPSQRAVRTYADAKVIDSIANSDTTRAPSRNAVYDALATKQDTLSGGTNGYILLSAGGTPTWTAPSSMGGVTYRFNVNGSLGAIDNTNFKRIDGGLVRNTFSPSACKITLETGGRSGNLTIDVRKHQRVNTPVLRIEPDYESGINTITNIAPAHATQSIARSTAQLSTNSIAFVKTPIQIRSVIPENGKTRYYVDTQVDNDWVLGDYVNVANCQNTSNNGNYALLSKQSPVDTAGFYSLLLDNTAGVAEINRTGKYDRNQTNNYAYTDNVVYNTNLGSASNTAATVVYDSDETSDGGRILVGTFTTWNGVAINRIVKLTSTGVVDSTFNTNISTGFNADVTCVKVQSDGKILIGGNFTTFKGLARVRLVRLNSDGTEDTSFYTNLGTGFSAIVRWMTLNSSQQIIVVGDFITLNGTTRNRIVRLNTDGTVDTAHYTNLGTALNGAAYFCAIDPNTSKLYVGGDFTTIGATTRNKICRLNTDGTHDTTFAPTGVGFAATAGQYVWGIAIQQDSKIVCTGTFTTFNAVANGFLVRLDSTGALDATFNTNRGAAPNALTYRAALVGTTGLGGIDPTMIHVTGTFTTIGGGTYNRYVVLNFDGSINIDWTDKIGTGFNGNVWSVKNSGYYLYFSGEFTTNNGWSYNRYMRTKHGVIGTGTVQLNYAKYTMSSSVGTEFVVGENALAASHTSANDNGNKTIFFVSGNDLYLKSSTAFVAQTGAAGNINVNRWKYATSVTPSTSLVVGENAKMASHTTGANNGNFPIKVVAASGVTVYNEAGVAQAGVAGTINTNRWIYNGSLGSYTYFNSDSQVTIQNTTTAANNGTFNVVEVGNPTAYDFTIYNEAGVAQTSRTSPTGEAWGNIKKITLSSGGPSITGYSMLEFNFTQSNVLYNEGSYYRPFAIVSDTEFYIDEIGLSRQEGLAGFLEVESKTLFSGTEGVTIPASEASYLRGRRLVAYDASSELSGTVDAGMYLGIWVLENFTDGCARDMTIYLE